jgi:DUF4097 and DUF4098 domain-containing protein YvlB
VVAVKEIRGSVEISNPSGGVILEAVDGDATIRSSYEAIRVETSYADVDFVWPGIAAMAFDLESSYGSIVSDFPAVSRERGSRSYVEGRVGQESSNSAALTISARNGSVNLRKR